MLSKQWQDSDKMNITPRPFKKASSQDKESILPVATLSIALYVFRRSTQVSQRCRARGGNFVIDFINTNKWRQLPKATELAQA